MKGKKKLLEIAWNGEKIDRKCLLKFLTINRKSDQKFHLLRRPNLTRAVGGLGGWDKSPNFSRVFLWWRPLAYI